MTFHVGKEYSGFKLIEQTEIKEIRSTALKFKHIKSACRLLYIKNDDDNKVFAISFRTPPQDSTGLPHILEHSVLCGSRKYPSKDPFVELAKGSLNTFLNAMTFPDKTMYPIASRNDKDFHNLMSVYLDAVFYPNIYDKPQIFAQEGWHYDIKSPEDEISYKGVVYNEMKGVFSSPEQIMFRKIQESLFPDTAYGYDSGGDPEVIPKLSRDQFLDYHRNFYHPSNSYIYLYGNGDIMKHLELINDEYLSDFHEKDIDSKIDLQKPYTQAKTCLTEYSISQDESEVNKTFLSLNFVVGQSTNPELHMAFDILTYLLLHTSASPLKKALLEASLGEDVFGSYDNSILQPVLSVVVKNTNEDLKEKFETVVFDTLQELVEEGIDKELVEAAINIYEFKLKEADYGRYPKGLIYGMKAMESWLYNENPLLHLTYEPLLEKVRAALSTNYFENLIENYLLYNQHRTLVIVKPKKGLVQEVEERVREELALFKESLTVKELEDLINNTKNLKKYQEEANKVEDLEKIPLISLEDIDREVDMLPLIEKKQDNIPVLFHPLMTNDILYISLVFDTRVVPQDLIPYISLLSLILGRVNTKKYGYEDLAKQMDIYTGGIDFNVEAFSPKNNHNDFLPKFIVRSSSLTGQIPKLFELMGEILGNTKFDNPKRLKEIIQETKSRLEMNILQNGHTVAARRATSYFSPIGYYKEKCIGIEFYKFIVDLEKNFDFKAEQIQNNLQELSRKIFNRQNLIISVGMEEENYKDYQENSDLLMKYIDDNDFAKYKYSFSPSRNNEGLLTSSKVQYVAKAYNFKELGYDYTGHLQVLKTIIGLNYLWNKIRVTGGAYGAMVGFSRSGNFYFTSYRDPNLDRTLKAYNLAYDYIKNFDADARENEKYIIGTLSNVDAPLTPYMKTQRSIANYISGISKKDLQRERDEILNTKPEDIRNLADLVKDTMDQNILCVLGNEEKIRANKEIFDKLVRIFD